MAVPSTLLAGVAGLNTSQTLEQFLISVEQRAYRMAIIATGNREDALDVVQDAMTKLVTKYAGRGADEWGPLFYRIMQTTIRDWYRRSRIRNGLRHLFFRQDEEDPTDPIDNLPDERGVTPERTLDDRQAIEAIELALQELSLRQQQVFLLRAWEGLDVRQTAAAMGCSQGSVKTHYARAVQALRRLLQGYDDDAE